MKLVIENETISYYILQEFTFVLFSHVDTRGLFIAFIFILFFLHLIQHILMFVNDGIYSRFSRLSAKHEAILVEINFRLTYDGLIILSRNSPSAREQAYLFRSGVSISHAPRTKVLSNRSLHNERINTSIDRSIVEIENRRVVTRYRFLLVYKHFSR